MLKGQSRKASAVEALSNIVVGYVWAVFANSILFPLFGYSITVTQNLLFALAFTVVSFIRAYTMRRLFNEFHKRGYFVER